ncbi:MAG: deoxyribose-phosphate aldolase [Proteobacteria bacterium]|nr:MAG: deoxyribose-phosphate aldolase [Pseudomonadota bacterium]
MNLAATIDHTNLSPATKRSQIEAICQETETYGFASACIHPYWVAPMAKQFPNTRLCTVINFPLGLQTTGHHEAERAVLAGAKELDIVANPAKISEANWKALEDELNTYRQVFSEITLKLIIESCDRSSEEIIQLTKICGETGFDYIKTSTGWGKEGATIEAITLIKTHAPKHLKIKASGGIKTAEQTLEMIKAGAHRIGTSNAIKIMEGCETHQGVLVARLKGRD